MRSLPLNPMSDWQMSDGAVQIQGNVTLHDTVAIAPGVLLQADPGSHIVIAAGVCIGSGSILHAYGGVLEIEAESSLGSGVLIVGTGKIGKRACIGSRSTLYNCCIEEEQVVPSGHLVGDPSLVLDPLEVSEEPQSLNSPDSTEPAIALEEGQEIRQVYGLASFNRLMIKLFPYRDTLNQPLSEQSPSDHPGIDST